MSNNKPAFRVVSPEPYTTSNGEEKVFYTEVGSGWKIKNGGVSIKLRRGIAVSGELVIFANPSDDDSAEQ